MWHIRHAVASAAMTGSALDKLAETVRSLFNNLYMPPPLTLDVALTLALVLT